MARECRVPLPPEREGKREELLTLIGDVTRSKIPIGPYLVAVSSVVGRAALTASFLPRNISMIYIMTTDI